MLFLSFLNSIFIYSVTDIPYVSSIASSMFLLSDKIQDSQRHYNERPLSRSCHKRRRYVADYATEQDLSAGVTA